MRRLVLLLTLGVLLVPSRGRAASPITVAWDASAIPPNGVPIAYYDVVYGPASGQYTVSVNVGNVTQATLPDVPAGPAFFAVRAIDTAGQISPFSSEVSTVVPASPPVADPRCVFPLGDRAISLFPTALQKTGSGGAGSRARLDFQVSSPNSPVVHLAIRSGGKDLSPADNVDGASVASLAGLWFSIPTTSGTFPVSILAANAYGCVLEKATAFSVTVP